MLNFVFFLRYCYILDSVGTRVEKNAIFREQKSGFAHLIGRERSIGGLDKKGQKSLLEQTSLKKLKVFVKEKLLLGLLYTCIIYKH